MQVDQTTLKSMLGTGRDTREKSRPYSGLRIKKVPNLSAYAFCYVFSLRVHARTRTLIDAEGILPVLDTIGFSAAESCAVEFVPHSKESSGLATRTIVDSGVCGYRQLNEWFEDSHDGEHGQFLWR